VKETDLYAPVKQWLENKGYEVYAEVQLSACGPIADVVAVKAGPEVVIVELKTMFGLPLLEQTHKRRHLAHWIYAAVPAPKDTGWRHGYRYLELDGTGLLQVFPRGIISEVVPPAKCDAPWVEWVNTLCEAHKLAIGGTAYQ